MRECKTRRLSRDVGGTVEKKGGWEMKKGFGWTGSRTGRMNMFGDDCTTGSALRRRCCSCPHYSSMVPNDEKAPTRHAHTLINKEKTCPCRSVQGLDRKRPAQAFIHLLALCFCVRRYHAFAFLMLQRRHKAPSIREASAWAGVSSRLEYSGFFSPSQSRVYGGRRSPPHS